MFWVPCLHREAGTACGARGWCSVSESSVAPRGASLVVRSRTQDLRPGLFSVAPVGAAERRLLTPDTRFPSGLGRSDYGLSPPAKPQAIPRNRDRKGGEVLDGQ